MGAVQGHDSFPVPGMHNTTCSVRNQVGNEPARQLRISTEPEKCNLNLHKLESSSTRGMADISPGAASAGSIKWPPEPRGPCSSILTVSLLARSVSASGTPKQKVQKKRKRKNGRFLLL